MRSGRWNSGRPFDAMRNSARSMLSSMYGGSPSTISIAMMPIDHTSAFVSYRLLLITCGGTQ